jgi:hypothetical protein
MATTNTISNPLPEPGYAGAPALLVSLASLSQEAFEAMLANLAQAFPDQSLVVASPDASSGPEGGETGLMRVVGYTPAVPSPGMWTLTAADFVNAHQLAKPRFPLAIDLCCSARMLERLAAAGQRFTASNQPDGLVWPVAEASVAGYTILEVDVGTRVLPQPTATDLNTVLAQVTGSLFTDVEAKAAWWQRARPLQPARVTLNQIPATGGRDVQSMIDSFRLAYTNLQEIWSLVLPPQSLLGLKRLSVMPPSQFRMGDSLWARIVYDFLLAYRLRTINRGHLLGALTPLYLAWVASHILITEAGTDPERHIEAVAAAFEADKAYLVSRWRWPDRFNP